jgi:hypothetical protein
VYVGTKVHPTFDIASVGVVDAVAASLLKTYDRTMLQRFIRLATFGDGNCCYRAMALRLFGNASMHQYVRLMAAIEMLLHRNFYDVPSGRYCGSFMDDRILTFSYRKLIAEL